MSAEEYGASVSVTAVPGGSVGPGLRPVVYIGADDSNRAAAKVEEIRGPGIADGNESDTSTWSLAGGSE